MVSQVILTVLFYVEMANNMRQAATTKHKFNRSV